MQRILVVDDDRLVAQTVSLVLKTHGFEVLAVHSAKEALSSAHDFSPDLMLCDIDMPGRDGIELMGDIGEALPGCRILVLTGHYSALGRVRDRALSLRQPVGILTKPCQPTELLREADAMLRQNGLLLTA